MTMPVDEHIANGYFVGLMSGTSLDGIDVALCRFTAQPELVAAHTYSWDKNLRAQLLDLAQTDALTSADTLGYLDTHVGKFFAAVTLNFLHDHNYKPHDITALGSHGQTIRHRPQAEHAFTWQLGNPWVMSENSAITTVADFRRADMAAGGQGAPLIPAFHQALFQNHDKPCAILNLGGIANITLLHANNHVGGFDTGPANALMDTWCARHRHTSYDKDGAFARQGTPHQGLLRHLLDDDYFQRPPPKSTGREYFHLDWLNQHLNHFSLSPEDVQATLLELTATTIKDAIQANMPHMHALYVCGGGVHNQALMHRLRTYLEPAKVASTATLGADPDFIEAMGFAWLARRRLLGLPANCPDVTGAKGSRLLGSIHPAA